MKKLSIIILLLVVSIGAMAQTSGKKVEILYFKANLSCCQARACNNLENITKEIITKNFSSNEVVFKTIALASEASSELIKKYNAKSQTLIIVNKKQYIDLSKTLAKFARDNDKDAFEKELLANIKKLR